MNIQLVPPTWNYVASVEAREVLVIGWKESLDELFHLMLTHAWQATPLHPVFGLLSPREHPEW